jgi:hypothetical protein
MKTNGEHCGINTRTMIPFSTTVLLDGHYAEYEIALGDDHYRGVLVQYGGDSTIIPSEILFWQQGKRWVSTLEDHKNIVPLLGIAVETYLFKAAAYESYS